jgi:acyl-CoA thioester hydrolase
MGAPAGGPDLTQRERYRFVRREALRYLDMDAQGHVNNLAIGAIAENGRAVFMMDEVLPLLGKDRMFVVAQVTMTFRRELFFPGEVELATGISRIGASSAVVGQALFGAEGCAATVETVLVLIDKGSRRSASLPEALRARLGNWLLGP